MSRGASFDVLTEALKLAGVPVPAKTAGLLVDAVAEQLTSEGKLQAEYAKLDAEDRMTAIRDLVEDVMAQRDPQFLTIQAQLDQVVELLSEQLRGLGSARSGPSRFLHVLDRTGQWAELRRACEVYDEHCAFILHGPSQQNVEFFCKRVRRFIHDHTVVAHDLVEVYRTLAEIRAVRDYDWGGHLLHALASEGEAVLAQALRDRTRDRRLMIMLSDGNRPLRLRRSDERVGLGQRDRAGLCGFLTKILPAQLEAAKCQHPVRVLVPIEYDFAEVETDDKLFVSVVQALDAAPGIRHVKLDPLHFPSWDEVWKSVKTVYGDNEEGDRLPSELGTKCRKAYNDEANKRERERSFAALAEALDRVLDRYMEAD